MPGILRRCYLIIRARPCDLRYINLLFSLSSFSVGYKKAFLESILPFLVDSRTDDYHPLLIRLDPRYPFTSLSHPAS